MGRYILISILFVAGGLCLWGGYEAIIYRRTYWFAPTVSGFRTRKSDKARKPVAYFLGILSLICGALLLYLGLMTFTKTGQWQKTDNSLAVFPWGKSLSRIYEYLFQQIQRLLSNFSWKKGSPIKGRVKWKNTSPCKTECISFFFCPWLCFSTRLLSALFAPETSVQLVVHRLCWFAPVTHRDQGIWCFSRC